MSSLAEAIDAVAAADLHALPGPELAERFAELHRQANRLHAEYLSALEVFDRTGAALASHGSTTAWVRDQLHRSPGPASRDVHLARDLADAFR